MSAIASFYLLSNRIINDLFRCLRLRNCGDFVGDYYWAGTDFLERHWIFKGKFVWVCLLVYFGFG